MVGRSFSAGRQGTHILAVLLIVVAFGLLWFAKQLGRDKAENVLLAVLALQLLWIPMRWRMSVYAFMVYVVVEGFLLNYFWTMPQLNLAKDAIVMTLFIVLGVATVTRRIFPVPWTAWLMPFLCFALIYFMQVFNPRLPNLLVGLIGVRVMLLYALLVPIAYWFFDRRERVFRFFLFMVLLSIPVSLFGIFQYFVGPGWMISLSPGFTRTLYYAIGDPHSAELLYFRTLSTFVATGSFSNYLWFMMTISVALLNMKSLRAHRAWIITALALQFLAQLTSGGRSAFVYFGVSLVLFLSMRGRVFRLVPALALLVIVFIVGLNLLGPVIQGRYQTILDWNLVRARNVPLGIGWLTSSMAADSVGYGAGYATIASRHAGVTDLNQKPVENTLARVRFETGIVGFIVYLLFIAATLVECVRVPMRMRDPELAWPTAACAAFILVNLTVNLPFATPFDVSPSNVYIWFFLGFLARVPQLAAAPVPSMTPSARLSRSSIPEQQLMPQI
jgi:heme exporter protein D